MDCRLELVAVPVSDVDRAIAFYVDQVGFNLDYDHKVSPELRFVQLTPRGSACSIAIGVGVTPAEPGSVVGMQVVVDDAAAAREDLLAHGVDASEVEDVSVGPVHVLRRSGRQPLGGAGDHPPVLTAREPERAAA